MIIGLVGKAGSGKDTVAEYIRVNYGFKKLSFASKLKDAVAVIFGWDRSKLEGISKEDREWREIPDPYWSKILGYNITPRTALRYIGTDMFREFNSNIWLDSCFKDIDLEQNYVITDCRFPNEADRIKSMGGILIKIKRNNIISNSEHASEKHIDSIDVNYVINNNYSFDDLNGMVDNIMYNLTCYSKGVDN